MVGFLWPALGERPSVAYLGALPVTLGVFCVSAAREREKRAAALEPVKPIRGEDDSEAAPAGSCSCNGNGELGGRATITSAQITEGLLTATRSEGSGC